MSKSIAISFVCSLALIAIGEAASASPRELMESLLSYLGTRLGLESRFRIQSLRMSVYVRKGASSVVRPLLGTA